VFGVESRVYKALLNETLYRGEGLSDEGAFQRHK
jgi:hypothetical protein